MKAFRLTLVAGIALSLISPVTTAFDIIAHRGASGYLPEHTLEAATLAHAQQPDFIEQDVVITKDNIPVVLHDIHLETVTNVETVFPDRARSDGHWYVRDFTFAELSRLQIHERQQADGKAVFPNRYAGTTARFRISTLQEHIELITQLNRKLGQNIGFYTEIKSPAWHQSEGVDASKIVLDTFRNANVAPEQLYIQCFDFAEVRRIRRELGYTGNLIMLVGENEWQESATDYDWILSAEGIAEVASVADGMGPRIRHLIEPASLAAGAPAARPWLKKAQDAGLIIHPYTFRMDALPAGMTAGQLLALLTRVANVDGVFTDQVPPVRALTKREE